MPKLDLTKVKPYEDSKKKDQPKPKQMSTLQPAANTKISHYLQQASMKLADSQTLESFHNLNDANLS